MKEQQPRGAATQNLAGDDASWPLIQEFVATLHRGGLSESSIRDFIGPAKHFLVWLGQQGRELPGVDVNHIRTFLGHACKCPRPPGTRYLARHMQSRTFKARVLQFVEFLEDTGRIHNRARTDDGLARLDEFAAYLTQQGYASATIERYGFCCRHFVVWLRQHRIRLDEVDEAVLRQFDVHDCICPGLYVCNAERNQDYRAKVRRFVRFVATIGVIRHATSASRPEDDRLWAFKDWLRRHRGIGESSISRYALMITKLLPQLGEDPGRYDAVLINRVLLDNLEGTSREGVRQLCSSLRMYLRFLVATDVCRSGLLGAVPRVPRWRMATLPRYILHDDVERVIASCDLTTHRGLRDRAILLLLARLALRGGDVAHLRLEDIDWNNALIRVSGKTRHEVALPLPQDVGDALLAYIEHARPKVGSNKVFIRAIAPFKPFTSSSPIAIIVRDALMRAGIDNANLRGAYLLRHSAATHMLRSGATLEAVSTVLRHRSPETTTIYAKVDAPMLAQVVQPWIGSMPCK
ncbi:tyrosine-type recombinase/integrase [Pseudomonas aeruginosa]|uniref:tyrosine-type recombinase/integrase n=1 Tax=Pseudomonas aeruginosa TaxID=287 RepID=UPI0023586092|nr:tyrosine-type recombinase/integrase [Pseudomonas aeruginosa]MDE8657660.1 tyrosine-type recombinase/integrase [Pseudomonas aeruginosa]MDE8663403.1 tyrosine-type recombinase/integrase [Pseudomonas aeruginosa]HBO4445832.1 tyrosine-type recombinase/integrase [Pseudomonas aeruginosa]